MKLITSIVSPPYKVVRAYGSLVTEMIALYSRWNWKSINLSIFPHGTFQCIEVPPFPTSINLTLAFLVYTSTLFPSVLITVTSWWARWRLQSPAGASIVYPTVCSGVNQRKPQSPVPLAFVRGIHRWPVNSPHNVIMGAMASPIAGASFVYPTVCSGVNQRKPQSSVPLAVVMGIHRWPVNSPHKGPATPKMFLFDDVIMSPSPPHDGPRSPHYHLLSPLTSAPVVGYRPTQALNGSQYLDDVYYSRRLSSGQSHSDKFTFSRCGEFYSHHFHLEILTHHNTALTWAPRPLLKSDESWPLLSQGACTLKYEIMPLDYI